MPTRLPHHLYARTYQTTSGRTRRLFVYVSRGSVWLTSGPEGGALKKVLEKAKQPMVQQETVVLNHEDIRRMLEIHRLNLSISRARLEQILNARGNLDRESPVVQRAITENEEEVGRLETYLKSLKE
jgi:hypothetical protein